MKKGARNFFLYPVSWYDFLGGSVSDPVRGRAKTPRSAINASGLFLIWRPAAGIPLRSCWRLWPVFGAGGDPWKVSLAFQSRKLTSCLFCGRKCRGGCRQTSAGGDAPADRLGQSIPAGAGTAPPPELFGREFSAFF